MAEHGEATRRQSRSVRFRRWRPTTYGQTWMLALAFGVWVLTCSMVTQWIAGSTDNFALPFDLLDSFTSTVIFGTFGTLVLRRRRRVASRPQG
jgi:hypothetical protein